ncbi:M28 family peptidase [Bowmanella yangjiangensis]|uniref:M28 family peptidase n=1 Tax=Bowmanella yangjiangensis TaxID=2811230 RepID=A0ABS3CQT7_9ALTE|nr:M28 family peptidase [Bowmanella yangjiangensis]MBN7819472.1 M28 family peptidase [Bowmanella yangjiangensis]
MRWSGFTLLLFGLVLPTFADELLWRHLQVLSSDEMEGRRTGSHGAELARSYIKQVFTDLGLRTFHNSYEMPFTHHFVIGQLSGVNLVGWLPGKGYSECFIVVSAHYDHLGKQGHRIFNGADDNASGVSVLLYLAAALKTHPAEHSVIFLATDAEERGLYGARAFVDAPPVTLSSMVVNLNLDMLGYGGSGNKLWVGGSKKHPQLLPAVNASIGLAPLRLKTGVEGIARGYRSRAWINYDRASDHAVFGQAGIPYLYLGVGEHRFYHTEEDEIERIDRDYFSKAAETALIVLRQLDQLLVKSTPVESLN